MEGFKPELIKDLLSRMTSDNVLVELAMQTFSRLRSSLGSRCPCRQGPVPLTAADNPPLSLPAANPFLPDNLSSRT